MPEFTDYMTPEWIDDRFNYHAPTPEQITAMEKIRDACKALAQTLTEVVPSCADRTVVMRDIMDVRMRANQAIIFNVGQHS